MTVTVALLALTGCLLPLPAISPATLQPPGPSHWLGTNALGQDVLMLLANAAPNTLMLAFGVGSLPVLIALLLASLAAVAPDWLDQAILKLTDVLLVIPSVLILMLLAALTEPGLWGLIAMLSAVAWMDDLRILRAAITRELLRDNVAVARSFGASRGYLLSTHVWPALLPIYLALFIQNARRGVLQSAGLAFLGLTDPRLPGWGAMLQSAQAHMHTPAFWWLLLPPLVALSVLLLSLSQLSRLVTRRPAAQQAGHDSVA